MIDVATLLLLRKIISSAAILVGIYVSISVFKTAWHLEDDMFGSIIKGFGFFSIFSVIAVALFASTLLVPQDASTQHIVNVLEILGYIFIIVALMYSSYVSGLASEFGKSIENIDSIIDKRKKHK